jgi:hypothetical protein
VFRGGWTLESAEAVTGEPRALEYLAELRERSLVLATEQEEPTRAAEGSDDAPPGSSTVASRACAPL